jgi:transcriptional regulator with XRE-family HTH domain
MRRFGEILRDARTHCGLTQKELAKSVPTDHTYISKLEKGVCLPPRKLAIGLADALGINEAEERIKFLSAAGVLSDEDLREFQLVRVGSIEGGQALTQGLPAQQLPSVAGINEAMVQHMLMLLQALTTAIPQFTAAVGQFMTAGAQLQAQVAALLQMNTVSPTLRIASHQNPEKMEPRPSVEQSPGKAPAGIVRKTPEERLAEGVGKVESSKESEVIIDWDNRIRIARTMAEIEVWDVRWTAIYQQHGSLLVLMKGLQGMTLHEDHYKARLQPIMEKKETAKLFYHILERLAQRRKAFQEQVQAFVFRHIMPIGALDWYVQTGFSRKDDYGLILGGLPAPEHQRAADIRHIISLLKDPKYTKYHLGLLTGERSKLPIYDTSFLELKGNMGLILENLATGERNSINTDQMLTDWFGEIFETLWTSEGMITDREEVIETLGPYADEAERLAEATVMS